MQVAKSCYCLRRSPKKTVMTKTVRRFTNNNHTDMFAKPL